MTAVWSDDQFDVSKTLIHKYGATNAQFDPAIPLCADCVSTWKFGGSGDESGYRSNLMMSQESPQNLQAFYLGAMRNRGWESSESELVLNALHQHAGHPDADRREARFSRGDEQMTMVFRYDSVADATKITVQRTD